MAIDLWKGPDGTAGNPTTGEFFDAANWSAGVPDATTDAVLGAGDYTVLLGGAPAHVHSISIGTGATVLWSGNTAPLITEAASTNSGTLRMGGTYLEAHGSFLNLGTIYGEVQGQYASLVAGEITNEGLISTTPGAERGYLIFEGTLLNDAGGTITTLSGPGQMILLGTTTNSGRIAAVGGGLVTTSGSGVGSGDVGTVTNIDGSSLNGGIWSAAANSTIWLAGTTISSLGEGTTVTLDGAGSAFRIDDGSGDPFYLESTLDQIYAGATLEVLGGRDWRSSEDMTIDGALHLGGGTFAPGNLRTDKGSVLSGYGTVESQAIVNGKLVAQVNPDDRSQTLQFTTFTDFNGRIVGNGTLELSSGTDTFTTGKVTVKHLLFDGADVQFDKNLTYAGELTVTTGTIDLTDSTLTLTGKATLDGSPTIEGDPGGKLVVTGDLHATDGTAYLDVRAIRVDGDVRVDHGTLVIAGTVSGSGDLSVGAGGELAFDGPGRLTADPLVTLDGAGATLAFLNLNSSGVRVADFDGRDKIDFAAVNYGRAHLSWRPDADGMGGLLRVSDGAGAMTVHLEENHSRIDFRLTDDGMGGALVTLTREAATAVFADAAPAAFGADAHAAMHAVTATHELHALTALV